MVVITVALSVRSIAVSSVSGHMSLMGAMAGHSATELERAIGQGITESLLWAALAGVVVAVLASLAVSSWLTTTLGQVAGAAHRIAAGHYDQRVTYGADDEVGGLVRSFNEMAGQLEQTETVRRELLATISHELRTPLTSIQGYMEGLIDGVVPEDPETYQLVHREASRLSRLVADIERLSRVEAGVERIEPTRLDTARVVHDVVERLRPQFEQKALALYDDVAPGTPDAWADEDKLVQVITNVLGNSFAYTAPGGTVHVRVHPSETLESVVFEVEDDGVGIAAADLPHIFERFFRADKSRSLAGGGAGIGLAVSRSLIEQMGGP